MNIPLSQTQLAIYYESVSRPGVPIYVIPAMIKLEAGIDIPRLQRAIADTYRRNPVLGMCIRPGDDGMPCFTPLGAVPDAEVINLSHEEFLEEEARCPKAMDVADAPMMSAEIYSTPEAVYLYLQVHHTAADGMSVKNIIDTIASLYLGREVPMPALTVADVVAHENELRNSPRYQEARQWYEENFSGAECESLPLPDRLEVLPEREEDPLQTLAVKSLTLSTPFADAFARSRECGVPLSVLLSGAFGYMAGVWSADSESCFCTITHGRKKEEEMSLVNMMVKTYPVWCRWIPGTTVKDYLHALALQQQKAKDYADTYSFAELCAATGFPATLNFSYRGSVKVNGYVVDHFSTECRRIGKAGTGDNMQWLVDHVGDNLVLTVEYCATEWSAEFIDSLVDTFNTVLRGFMEKENLDDIEFCSPEMLRKLDAMNEAEPVGERRTIVDVFRSHVSATPDRPVLVCDDVHRTYGEVGADAERIAGRLHSLGIAAGDVVAVIPCRDQMMLTATMGVLLAGAAYEPLDSSYPAERLNYMVRDAGAKIIIADRNEMFELEEDIKAAVTVIYTDEIAHLPEAAEPVPSPAADSTFIVLYTSGTTGKPKGVKLTHGNLTALCRTSNPCLGITAEDICAVYASYGFDACFFMLLTPLWEGAAVSIVPEEVRLDMLALNDFYIRNGVTFSFMTTQVGRIFATSVENTTLRGLACGGEKLVPCAPPAGFRFYNIYGPTEGTVYSHARLVDRLYTRVPIGRHLADYRNYILDSRGRRMPIGALGEMMISGPQVGAGYLNLPEKTTDVFLHNPFCDEPEYSRMYNTGDIVRLLPDGEADIIGRRDGQVKIRGFRIELAEVEGVIREYPGIKDATVQAFDDPAGGKFIAAYIVADEPVDISALNAYISSCKPPYMVPAVTMQIDAIPLTQNQKVNKWALPKPECAPAAEEDADINREPNLLERELCNMIADLLHLNRVPLSVSLAMQGLTSISSIRLAGMLYKRFGVNMKGSELINGATVLTLEDKILEVLLGSTPSDARSNAAASGETPSSATLTVSQQGVYADSMRNPGSTAYNIPVYFRFDPATDAEALAKAVGRILDAHPYLRDAHLEIGDDIEQTVKPHREAKVEVKEMTEDEFCAFRDRYIWPFDLMKAPLYRFTVVRTSEAVYLLMDIHHIVFDGTSLTVFLAQLKTLLQGAEIMPEEYSYIDYALAEQAYLEGDEGRKAGEYFGKMLADCEAASDIASDVRRSDTEGDRVILTHPVNMAAVEKFCREHSVTPAALYLAATCYATARFTTSEAAYISTISSGRADMRFAETFGMFVKTLPVALSISEKTALQYVRDAADNLAGAVEHQMYPYAKICADFNYAPNIVYEYQLGLVEKIEMNGSEVQQLSFGTDTLKFKIAVHVEETGGVPGIAVHYRENLYSRRLMQAFCDAVAIVAEEIIANPELDVRKLTMTDAAQREVLESYANAAETKVSELLFHNLMEREAKLHPDRAAVVACDRTLTYAELDRLANIVANNLIAKGVRHGDKVVMVLPRTSALFPVLYGILKTGAAYIPSSPDYPEERIKSIIEDADARYVVTEENVAELLEGNNDRKPEETATPDDLVYLIYTSGSTGKPKGVLLRHRGVVNYVTPSPEMRHTAAVVENCKVAGAVTTISFDMAVKDWGISLSNGLTVVFASDEQTNDPVALAALFADNNVDYISTTPSRLRQYMELDEFAAMMSRCRLIICGGEQYPEQILKHLQKLDGVRLFNTYGPTEITVSSNGAELTDAEYVHIGRPLAGYTEYIVDKDDNLLPPGVTGELIICGWPIGVGYNKRPEQTKAAFVEYRGLPAYRSGDYARWDEHGNVIILGRKDTQVKLRGLRIELGEIERVIGAVPGVAASHIMIRNVAGREHLCAYYKVAEGGSLTEEVLKAEMGKKLTDYMVPSLFVRMEAMPLTPNGKINTRALPEPEVKKRESGAAATNDLEKFFVDVFAGILGTDNVYADDNFFTLGGTSLTATCVMIAASKAGHRIVYADVFDNPTPQALARLITAREVAGDSQAHTVSAREKLLDPNYDYTAINALLAGNTLEAFRNGERRSLGNVLLLGATGFAGIHVLRELLTAYDCNVVCLGRDSRNGVDALTRLEALYFYYFGESPSDAFPGRLHGIKGDITRIGEDFDPGMKIDTVINCAANVKHFSAGTDIEDINYYGVLNLIALCKRIGATLIQTSTHSVAGSQPEGSNELLTERSLWIGQHFGDNKYVISKFAAERAVLEAVARGDIEGKVIRLGNLSPREEDGEFQINFRTNGFMNRLKSIYLIGCYPYSMYDERKDISPIDDVAKAIVLFSQTPAANVLFHGNNFNRVSLGNFFAGAAADGLMMKAVEKDEYIAALEKAKEDPAKLNALVGLMAYEGIYKGYHGTDYSNAFSNQVLLRMGFSWPVVSPEYIHNLVKSLQGLDFFEV